MKKTATFMLLAFSMSLSAPAQKIEGLFTPKASLSKNFSSLVTDAQALTLDRSRLSSLKNAAPEIMELDLPFERSNMVLDLKKVKITSDQFKVTEILGNGSRREINYQEGVFYQGSIRGREKSMVTISLIGSQVVGVLADEKGNMVLGAIEEGGLATDEYTLYRESAMKMQNPVTCFTSEEMIGQLPEVQSSSKGNLTGEPIDIYFECDYRFYQDKGNSTVNVVSYVLAFFNSVARLYEIEDIKVQVSQITVWTTPDPEQVAGLNDTDDVLDSFAGRMANSDYIGDYAHFLSRRSLGGGIAYVLGNPCGTNPGRYYRTAVSAVNSTFANYPTYSWTVQVVTHELGHNFGSQHTQWCGWTGGALDNCVATEGGSCPRGPAPVDGGTIMSYCHQASYGINFNNGFGTQPGNRIRQVIGAAACFGSCRMTIEFDKSDASCGLNNGSATVISTNSSGTTTYLWSNGETGQTLTNAAPGTYQVTVRDGSGCQVLKDIIIGSSGVPAIQAATPPTFCAGGNTVLNTLPVSGATYSWTRNGTAIPGATQASYTATEGGAYRVVVTTNCAATSNTVNVVVIPMPTITITPVTATIQKFQSVRLDLSGAASYNIFNQPFVVASSNNSLTVSPPSTTVYTIRGSNEGCEDQASATVIVIGCGEVTGLTTTQFSPSRIMVRWVNPQDVTTDSLQYRKVGETSWNKIFVTGQEYELGGLEPGASYEFNIVPICTTTSTFIPSATQQFNTPGVPNGLYVNLFPNPVTSESRIEIVSANAFTLQVSVYDISGKLVALPVSNGNFPAGQVIRSINGSGLAAGVYYVAVRINDQLQTIKMLVTR